MKILIICPNENTGGTERVSSIYFKVLSKKKYDVSLCSIFKPLKAFGLDSSTRSLETLLLSQKRKILRPFILYFYLIRMRLKGYSILIQGEYAAAISVFLPFKVSIRITNNIDSIKSDKLLLKKLLIRSLKCHRILAPHKNIISKDLALNKNIYILPNPVEIEFPNTNQKKSKSVILEKKFFRFLAVGQLNFQKDHKFLIETLKKLQVANEFYFKLDIFGEGDEMQNLKEKIINLGLYDIVNLKGWSNNPWDQEEYIAHLLTSRWEGYPNVLIEAAKNNIPSLIVPIPPCTTDIIKENKIGFVSGERTTYSYSKLITKYMKYLSRGKSYQFQFDSFLHKHNPLLLLEAIK